MQSLDQDVTVYYLCETGSEDAIITKLLDHYADESGHFHWEQKLSLIHILSCTAHCRPALWMVLSSPSQTTSPMHSPRLPTT